MSEEKPDVRSIMELFDLPGLGSKAAPESPARKKEGRTAEESRAHGQEAMADEDYVAAIEHFKKAVEQGGETAQEDLGAAYESSDMFPQAFYQYEKAKKSKKSGELFLGLSALYKRYGKVEEAVREMEEAIKAEPKNAYLHFKLAETLRTMGYRKSAREAIQGAIASDPDDHFYHYWLGDLLIEMGEFEESGKAIQAAIELSPGDEHLFQLAAISLWGQGKKKEAIRATRLSSDLDADNILHTLILHKFLLETDQLEEAKLEEEKVNQAEEYDRDLANRMLKPLGLTLE